MFNYTNPLVIISSVCFFLSFTKIHINDSRGINWIAISSIAAYLLHMNPLFYESYFLGTLYHFRAISTPLGTFFYTLAFIFLLFFAAVALDKIRLILWRMFLKVYNNIMRLA